MSAYLVSGTRVTEVEVEPFSAAFGRIRVRPKGSSGEYQSVFATQVFDTPEQAKADVDAWRRRSAERRVGA